MFAGAGVIRGYDAIIYATQAADLKKPEQIIVKHEAVYGYNESGTVDYYLSKPGI